MTPQTQKYFRDVLIVLALSCAMFVMFNFFWTFLQYVIMSCIIVAVIDLVFGRVFGRGP